MPLIPSEGQSQAILYLYSAPEKPNGFNALFWCENPEFCTAGSDAGRKPRPRCLHHCIIGPPRSRHQDGHHHTSASMHDDAVKRQASAAVSSLPAAGQRAAPRRQEVPGCPAPAPPGPGCVRQGAPHTPGGVPARCPRLSGTR